MADRLLHSNISWDLVFEDAVPFVSNGFHRVNQDITHIFAYLRKFMSFWYNFKNETLRPIDSSTSRNILIIIKSDVCFKIIKNTFFNVAVESTDLKFFHFKAHIGLYDDQMSPVEEVIGWSILFWKFCQKTHEFLSNTKSLIHSRKNTAVKELARKSHNELNLEFMDAVLCFYFLKHGYF